MHDPSLVNISILQPIHAHHARGFAQAPPTFSHSFAHCGHVGNAGLVAGHKHLVQNLAGLTWQMGYDDQ